MPVVKSLRIKPGKLHGAEINAGLAGTVMRFIPPIAAIAAGRTILDGDLQARKRPMAATISSLRQLGVEVRAGGIGGDTLPIQILGQGFVDGGEIEIDAAKSSQFVSALLLVGACFNRGVTLRHRGDRLPSLPHIEMTISVLRECGVQVTAEYSADGATWQVSPGIIQLPEITVESDLSNAGPFLAAAMITGGQIKIPNWPRQTTQAGNEFVRIFTAQGAQTAYRHDGGVLTLRGPEEIFPLDLDCHAIGELVPTLAAVCAFAGGPSVLRDIGQLRGHETDRLTALVCELEKVGVGACIVGDDLFITPPAEKISGYKAAKLSSYADHRMAAFGAILGLRIPGVEVENIETTSKTMPNFVELWEKMIAESQAVSVASATEISQAGV
ncbi:3-phosphoshikimate 1-carboxyvinyltransferase [Arcanobacterium hippocoleae]